MGTESVEGGTGHHRRLNTLTLVICSIQRQEEHISRKEWKSVNAMGQGIPETVCCI